MTSEVWLLGEPVSQSFSYAMQNAAFAAAGIDCRYVLHEVNREGLKAAVATLRADSRILGANVTIPHKESVIPLLDELDPLAVRIGAVNTISRQDTRLKGWNTDAEGFRRALDECGYIVEGRSAAIIGAGGAARAVALVLQQLARSVSVIARNVAQAQRLSHDLGLSPDAPVDIERLQDVVTRADLVVNATPADLPPQLWLRPDQRVFDVRSRRSAEGRSMLLHQGVAAFEIWTGKQPSVDAMRSALQQSAAAVTA